MCGEGLGGTNVVAVKTHLTTLKWDKHSKTDPNKRPFDKAIFIIRNPFNANIAEWHRQKTEHVQGQAGSNHIWYVSSHAYFGKEFYVYDLY